MARRNDDDDDDDTAIIELLRRFQNNANERRQELTNMEREFERLGRTLNDENQSGLANGISDLAGAMEELWEITNEIIRMYIEDRARRT
ncbi:MAG: hypothetical protein M3275_13710 [Thermoproteota archaeon]|nr:hypothetical protein [Thermoproteota archaeon]